MESVEFMVETSDFEEIATEFHARVQRVVWCNVATVDAECRTRSRVMHPIWEGATGWIGTWATSVRARRRAEPLKITQARRNPHVSLAYVAEITTPVYVDATVEAIDDVDGKRRFSELARAIPPPYGYDPAAFFGEPDDPRFAVLRLEPTHIALVEFPAPPGRVIVWRAAPGRRAAGGE